MLRRPWEGLPIAWPGGVDVVYDTVGAPDTLEVGLRVLRARGTIVQLGLSSMARCEWTPWYFKEARLVGSNAFGVEEVDGVRQHAIAHYLDLVGDGRIDLTGLLTHTFPLERVAGCRSRRSSTRARRAPSSAPSTSALPGDARQGPEALGSDPEGPREAEAMGSVRRGFPEGRGNGFRSGPEGERSEVSASGTVASTSAGRNLLPRPSAHLRARPAPGRRVSNVDVRPGGGRPV